MLFSVIIPTYHRNELLACCLESLGAGRQSGLTFVAATGRGSPVQGATLPPSCDGGLRRYEVIVTDDGKAATAEAMIRGRFPWVGWVRGPGRGPAANRNCGASKGRGDWVVFIDDDCVADSRWLLGLAGAIEGAVPDVIEGMTIIPNKRDNPFLHGVENLAGDCYWSCNLAVRREIFGQLKGFDEDFLIAGGEDMEFGWRIKREGLRTYFCREALVLHPQRPYAMQAFLGSVWNRKWILLYRQKTGAAPADSAGLLCITAAVVWEHLFALTRHFVYGWKDLRRDNWKTQLFAMFWLWLILPLQLPHLVWWEFRFRDALSVRTNQTVR